MTNDTSVSSLRADIKDDTVKSPRLSSLMFLRQFARVYICLETAGSACVIAN